MSAMEMHGGFKGPTSVVDEEVEDTKVTFAHSNDRAKLERYINFLPTIAFGANLLASWEAVAVSFQAGLLNGGPTSLIYGTLLSWFGNLALAASLAEMASITPTVGAQYRWSSMYAPPGFGSRAFWGLFQGWLTLFAWMAGVSQPPFLMGTSIQGLIIFNNDNYQPERWHGTLLAWAIFCIPVFVNLFARKALAPIEIVGGIAHIAFLCAWIITLVVLAPRSSTEFVFQTSIFGLSGWDNQGVQWCVGLLSAVFPLGGFDGVLHMSDEVKNAKKRVPQAMVYAAFLNGAMAFCFMICILYCLGDPLTALGTNTGYPIIEVLYGATKSKAGTTALMAFIVFNGLVAMFSGLASVSRLTWAFARDKGLPFSSFFSYVSPKLRIPINSLFLVALVIVLLQLINIASSTALFAILSLSTLGLYVSYFFPILFFLLAKLRGDHISYGPWKMWRLFGILVNIFSLAYVVFIIIWLPFPAFQPVTLDNFNYAGPILGVVIIFALLDWVTFGRKRFTPPVDTTHD